MSALVFLIHLSIALLVPVASHRLAIATTEDRTGREVRPGSRYHPGQKYQNGESAEIARQYQAGSVSGVSLLHLTMKYSLLSHFTAWPATTRLD